MNVHTEFVVEQVAPGVVRECTAEGELMIFSISDGSRATIIRWADTVRQTLLNWPTHQPCLMLHDLRHSGYTAFDKVMQVKFDELFALRPDLERWVAVVLPDEDCALLAHLSVRVRELLFDSQYPVHWRIYTSRCDATVWLLRSSHVL